MLNRDVFNGETDFITVNSALLCEATGRVPPLPCVALKEDGNPSKKVRLVIFQHLELLASYQFCRLV
jgi:hypothetical protein